jgi:DNA-binding PadR family transcriptional regulator
MSVKHALLALLERRPLHGYGLKSEFEARLGQAWPLNIGQVYTTLGRLERDGLVAPERAGDDGGDRRAWRITGPGRAALAEWFSTPVPRDDLARDELLVKVVAALDGGTERAVGVIRAQRTAVLELLQRHTRARADASRRGDLPQLLAADLKIASAEAEAAWLDRCEARVTGGRGRRMSRLGTADTIEEVPR